MAWWVVGAQILMPILLGMPAFAPLMMPPMRMVAMGSFVGHVLFGLILGAAFVWVERQRAVRSEAERFRRAA